MSWYDLTFTGLAQAAVFCFLVLGIFALVLL